PPQRGRAAPARRPRRRPLRPRGPQRIAGRHVEPPWAGRAQPLRLHAARGREGGWFHQQEVLPPLVVAQPREVVASAVCGREEPEEAEGAGAAKGGGAAGRKPPQADVPFRPGQGQRPEDHRSCGGGRPEAGRRLQGRAVGGRGGAEAAAAAAAEGGERGGPVPPRDPTLQKGWSGGSRFFASSASSAPPLVVVFPTCRGTSRRSQPSWVTPACRASAGRPAS
ncbi:unnamed protein product, partial [Prorocentrum cordatum]